MTPSLTPPLTPSLRTALARARSAEPPGPDFPAGRQVTPWPGEPLPVPPCLDRLLRLSLAGGRLRPAASAGALHPVNAHVLLGPGSALPPGRYAYDPVRHRLRRRGAAPADAPRGAITVLTVTARRTVSHYGHRGWPLLLLDTGHAAAALALAGAPEWCPDADGALLAAAAGLPADRHDWHGAEPEHALAAVRLTPGPADALAAWAAYAPTPPPPPTPHPPPPALEETWHLLAALTGPTGPTRAADPVPGAAGAWQPTRAPAVPAAVLLARRSATPPFRGVPEDTVLQTLLTTARTTGAPAWSLAVAPHPSEGAPPAAGPRGAAPAGSTGPREPCPQEPCRQGPRPEGPRTTPAGLAGRAARQAWPTEAGALLLAHGCPDDAPPDRIRRDHLLAGYGVGLAQAVATALGLASRPVGSWQDGPHGPAHIVHALALGLRTEGTDRS
ncbi:hypothetical protein [Streptomyces sp. NPDC006368]|uniref:hypothetical protein n=1 Tax=Streptomyces sp. NPDC006368 TaxID=3156760 RepID=UPI0033B9148A